MLLRIAVPITDEFKIYHDNPWTAPQFMIYKVSGTPDALYYELEKVNPNPWIEEDESLICDPMKCSDGCSDIIKGDLNHLADHYIILEAIEGCQYLIADTYCTNIEQVVKKANIQIYEILTFVHKPELAIKNLLIANKITPRVENIHKRS